MIRLCFLLLFLSDFAAANCFLALRDISKKSSDWRKTRWTTHIFHHQPDNPAKSHSTEISYMLYSKSLQLTHNSPTNSPTNSATGTKNTQIKILIQDAVSDFRNLENDTITVRFSSDSRIRLNHLNSQETAILQDTLTIAATKVAELINEKEPGKIRSIRIIVSRNAKEIMKTPELSKLKLKGDPLGKGEDYDEAPNLGIIAGSFITALYGAAHTLNAGIGSGFDHAKAIALPAIAVGIGIFEAARVYNHYKNRDFSIELPVDVNFSSPGAYSPSQTSDQFPIN